jgi:hypothetical protein
MSQFSKNVISTGEIEVCEVVGIGSALFGEVLGIDSFPDLLPLSSCGHPKLRNMKKNSDQSWARPNSRSIFGVELGHGPFSFLLLFGFG